MKAVMIVITILAGGKFEVKDVYHPRVEDQMDRNCAKRFGKGSKLKILYTIKDEQGYNHTQVICGERK